MNVYTIPFFKCKGNISVIKSTGGTIFCITILKGFKYEEIKN